MKRGVVLAGVVNAYNDNQGHNVKSIAINDDIVRSALVYWDKIEIPDTAIASVILPEPYETLAKESILSRQFIDCGLGGTIIGQFFGEGGQLIAGGIVINGEPLDAVTIINQAPVDVFYKLSKDKEILWSYLKNSETVAEPQSSIFNGRSLMVEITNRLPRPDASVTFDVILNFKEKRDAELKALRSELDDMYAKLAQLPDLEAAKAIAFNKVDLAILDLTKASSESFVIKNLKGLKFEINWTGAVEAAGLAGLAVAAGASLAHTAIAGGVAAIGKGIKISSSTELFGKKLPERLLPYKYILDVKNELQNA